LSGDWTRAVNLPVLVQVVNREYLGKMYENVGSVTPPMRGMNIGELVNPSKIFDCDSPDKAVFDSLPPFMQEIITGGLEWKGWSDGADDFIDDAPY